MPIKSHAVFEGTVLRGNKSTAYPNRQLFLDVESNVAKGDPWNRHSFRLGWTYYECDDGAKTRPVAEWKLHRTAEGCCLYIEESAKKRECLTIYGHNLYYDLQVVGFFAHFAGSGWKLKSVYDKGMTFILTITRDKATIRCISTTNYFDYSLAKLAENMGMEKGEVEFQTATDEELIPYCRQDVEILVQAVKKYQQFNRDHDTGKFAATRSSQAFNCFRHRFMDSPITIHHDKTVTDLERCAYFGGRTEMFRWGEQKGGPFVFLDVNSMYPFVMHKYQYPSKLVCYLENVPLEYVKKRLRYTAMVADVTIETNEPAYATRGKDKVLFPVGRFRTGLCTEGLRRAVSRGEIIQVHRLAVYESRVLFRSYVDYFYPLKARYKSEGNLIYTAIVKLFLNSLYGKFGQKSAKEESFDNPEAILPYKWDEIDIASGEHWTRTGMFGKEILTWGETNGRNAFVAIAAHVTEYARFTLWDLFNRLGRDRVLYCDTDSIVVAESDLLDCDLPLDNQLLGSLGVDCHTDRLVLHNLKDYETDAGRKTKGIPKDAAQIAPNTWSYEQFQGLATHQREQIGIGFLSRTVRKTLRSVYDKGEVLPDGRIVPYCLGGS